jgi:hypothetical protein
LFGHYIYNNTANAYFFKELSWEEEYNREQHIS